MVLVLVAEGDLVTRKLCIVLSSYKNIILRLRSSDLVDVPRFLVIFSFVSIVLAHFLKHAHGPCDTADDLCV